ncbi:putative O-methyltransferase [Nocardia brasiliensis NBRC 14402]|uniref:methyltransferase n=1 Tax=Nocardia brasiliensis TaxID=37326 RepID=UPI0002DE4C0D|nr:methyltransferase [Nocardia brasiliensis]ASF07416.1 methyltransferase domain-containing protein [Nocardia brasiliensis]GAJ83127.1 putative O-methyltransferase [Nocardia brasiliensis NBRC 14402]SUB55664.1 Multifunctional cyclase-dehydratase-3-O-methyl transferase tcmN [Nocardia brasiliensis]
MTETQTELSKPVDLTSLVPVLFGFAAFQQLRAASELQLFEYLDLNGPATSDDAAAGLGMPGKSARMLLLGTTSLGLTERDGDHYRLGATLAAAMADGTWPLLRNIIDFQQRLSYLPAKEYAESLRTGKNLGLKHLPGTGSDLYSRLEQTPELENLFFRGMHSWSELSNPVLLHQVDYAGVTGILDVGGGDAVNAIAIARAHPDLKITVFDLEGAVEVARDNIAAAGLGDRIDVIAGDMFGEPLPGGYDVALFAHQFVIWSPEQNRTLLRQAYAALPPGGRVLVFNAFADDDGRGPLYTALDNVYFATLPSEESTIYPWREHEEWLRAAGFAEVTRIRSAGWTPHGVIEGRKSDE